VPNSLRPLTVAVTAALALAATACSDDDATTAATTTSSTTTTTTTTADDSTTSTTSAPAEGPSYELVLEDPGQEPRQELRLDVTAGASDAVTQRQETHIEVRSGQDVQSSPSPVTELDLTYTVDELTDRGISASATYDDVRVVDAPGTDPAVVEQVRQVLDAFRSATAHTVHSRRGAILEARIVGLQVSGPAGAVVEQLATSLTDAVESLSVPFPEEAVGAGARWRVETETEIAGLPVAATSVVQLDQVTDDRAVGTLQQTMRFVPGDVEVLGVPATVVRGDLTGGGPIEWRRRGGLVPRSDLTTAGTTVLRVRGVELEQRQQQRITITSR